MIAILRAFAWMRWRVLVNSLDRTSARDTLERLSIAFEQLGPLLAGVLFIPSALGLAALSGYAGYLLPSAETAPLVFRLLGYLLLAASALCLAGPFLLPMNERTNAVRLLLLPIPRGVLYVAQSATALTDPWILLVVPIVVALPVGMAIAGSPLAAAAALAAGLLLVVVLLGLSSVAATVVHLVLRDRRRAELLALVFIVVVPIVVMLPGLMGGQQRRGASDARQREARDMPAPAWLVDGAARAFALTPSQLFGVSVRSAAHGNGAAAAASVLGLLITGVVLHGAGLIAFGRLLDSPGSSSSRRTSAALGRRLRVPGLSAGASAVAVSQLRLTIRTPRGRAILISPIGVFIVFAILIWRGGGLDFGFIEVQTGLALATFGAGVCLLSILPFAMNQFAIDRAGLTLQLLSPLSDLDILLGKAAGLGLVAGLPALLCVAIAAALFPDGSPALWMSVPLGVFATYLLTAPGAAALSAMFPRAVDLNSIGRASNAHAAAGLLGLAVFVLSALPPVLLSVVAVTLLDRPYAAPLLLLAWTAVALAAARLLFTPVSLLFGRRRENLAMLV